MPRKAAMKNMLVVLPGITGSVLTHDDYGEVWAPAVKSVATLIGSLGRSLASLALSEDEVEVTEEAGNRVVRCADSVGGIRATSLMPFSFAPGIAKWDGYTGLKHHLHEIFDLTDGDFQIDGSPANYLEFPYDWRRDNRCAAWALKGLVDRELPKWQSKSPGAKVVLLAHSMGGLVSRYYIDALGGHTNTRALFTFGTPFRGAMDSLDYLVNGYRKFGIELKPFTELMRTLPSAYQLLPIYEAIKSGDRWQRLTEIGLPDPVDKTRVTAARKFHDELHNSARERAAEGAYEIKMLPVVGYGHRTLQSASLAADGTFTFQTDVPPAMGGLPPGGDGRVPIGSAVPDELWDERQFWQPANQKHSVLQNAGSLLTDIGQRLKWLQGARVPPPRGPLDDEIPEGVDLEVDDLYVVDEPVVVSVRPPTTVDPKHVGGRVIPLVGDDAGRRELAFAANGADLTAEVVGLAAGAYRVEVWPVSGGLGWSDRLSDVFAVVG